jgi:hypothetical protein
MEEQFRQRGRRPSEAINGDNQIKADLTELKRRIKELEATSLDLRGLVRHTREHIGLPLVVPV